MSEEACKLMAAASGGTPDLWSPVESPEPDTWYDWADLVTGKVGQCCMGSDGKWRQEPRGVAPVVLAYLPALDRDKEGAP